MSGKGSLGWLILAVALAVPAFMFWNWWKLLNNRPADVGRKAASGQVFPGMKNPLAPSTATATSAPAAPAGVASSTASAAPNPQTAVPAPAPAAVPATPGSAFAATPAPQVPKAPESPAQAGPPGGEQKQAAPSAAAPAPQAPGSKPAGEEEPTLRFTPKLDRDPTLSPMDIKKLAQIALEQEWEKERLRKEAEEAERRKHYKPPPPKPIDITTTIRLMGITAVPGSVTAIVAVGNDDGEIVRIGDRLRNGVQVIKMNPTAVWFKYKNKIWQRSVNKD